MRSDATGHQHVAILEQRRNVLCCSPGQGNTTRPLADIRMVDSVLERIALPEPAITITVPSANKLAVWRPRASFIGPVIVHVLLAESNSSTVFNALSPKPPATRTIPLL